MTDLQLGVPVKSDLIKLADALDRTAFRMQVAAGADRTTDGSGMRRYQALADFAGALASEIRNEVYPVFVTKAQGDGHKARILDELGKAIPE